MTAAMTPVRSEAEVKDAWMAYLDLGEMDAVIYDPANGIAGEPLDNAVLARVEQGEAGYPVQVRIVRGDNRLQYAFDDDGEIFGWEDGSAVSTLNTQAFALGYDDFGMGSADDIRITWERVRLWTDALIAAEATS